MVMREIECPFCGHQNVAMAHINVLCPCGAKYYIHNGEFWDRKKRKDREKHRLYTCLH